ncbi:hypothetical protein BO79DRAFT_14723 [Aspergillus costaricaensis CBS 115574]|uniref:Uncharacterized protein n=1 Tax=Aspergillus costaricaensis CBS 115574 TaxID=1448317 RepID=A0ACD1IE86_9EURO|nr:hypothetical protein BO79DRAFT_14723 [Aspergillus costaricaensis CBS 115574]RAK88891.1 hypothetical protein BO79DRAFT_14723 [Aspergillus costaricaensis CBS 115574]
MEEVLSRVFDSQRQRTCIECNHSVNYERRFNNNPMRLVVELGPNVSIQSHIKDITLSYHDDGGEGQRVTNRWIEGIYSPVPGLLCLLWNGAECGVRWGTGKYIEWTNRWLDIHELHHTASRIRRCPNRIGSWGYYTIERPLQSQWTAHGMNNPQKRNCITTRSTVCFGARGAVLENGHWRYNLVT